MPPEPITLKIRCSISSDAREETKDEDGNTSVVTPALSAIPREKNPSPSDEDDDGDDVVSPRGRDSLANTPPTVAATTAATQSPSVPPSSTSGALWRNRIVHGRMIRGISKLARGLASVSAALAGERRANAGGDNGDSEGGDNDGLASSASNSVSSTNRPEKVLVEVIRGLYSATLAIEPEDPVDLEDVEEQNGTHRSCGNGSVDKKCADHEGSER